MTIDLPTTATLPQRTLECGRCGAPFICGGGTGEDGGCWCAAPAFRLSAKPAEPLAGGDCLCPECLAEVAALLARAEGRRDGDV